MLTVPWPFMKHHFSRLRTIKQRAQAYIFSGRCISSPDRKVAEPWQESLTFSFNQPCCSQLVNTLSSPLKSGASDLIKLAIKTNLYMTLLKPSFRFCLSAIEDTKSFLFHRTYQGFHISYLDQFLLMAFKR